MKKSYLLLAILPFLIFTAYSCKKIKGNKLLGEWTLAIVAGSDTTEYTSWTFNEGNQLIRDAENLDADTAYFFLEEDLGQLFVNFHDLDPYTDGNYEIKKLSKDILILDQTNPYVHKEFYKD